MEGIGPELIVGDEVTSNSLAIMRAKELCWRMPKLTSFVRLVSVQLVLEVGIAFA